MGETGRRQDLGFFSGSLPNGTDNRSPDLLPTSVVRQAYFDWLQWHEDGSAWNELAEEHFGRIVEPDHLERSLDVLRRCRGSTTPPPSTRTSRTLTVAAARTNESDPRTEANYSGQRRVPESERKHPLRVSQPGGVACMTLNDGLGALLRSLDTSDTIDDPYSFDPPPGRTIPYGETWAVSSFRCHSSTDGMECWSTVTGHGFFLSCDNRKTY